MTDKIRQSLEDSSKKIAKQIAGKMKERRAIDEEVNELHNHLTMLEAKVEVHRDERDRLQVELKEKKRTKQDYYNKRDELISEKRSLQDQFYASEKSDMRIEEKINAKSDEIGDVIEKSKAIVDEMQELYEKSQVEHEAMIEIIETLRETKYETERKKTELERKSAEIENELGMLRRKMKSISERLESQ